MPSNSVGWGLTGRIVRATFAAGVVVFLSAGILNLAGTYRLSRAKIVAADAIQLQMLEDDIASRVARANNDAHQIAVAVARSSSLESSITQFVGPGRTFDTMLVIDARGRTSAAFPSGMASRTLEPEVLSGALSGTVPLLSEHDDPRAVWLLAPVRGNERNPRTVVCRMAPGFFDLAIEHIASGAQELVVILNGAHVVAHLGELSGVDLARASWVEGKGGIGTISIPANGSTLTGSYTDIYASGLSLRAFTAQPTRDTMVETLTAAAPALVALALGGMGAILLAWGTSVGITRPLRSLERSARRAAEGSYVRPIDIHRDDEIGRVADAFDAVALRLNAMQDLSRLLAGASQLDEVLDVVLSAMEHIVGKGVSAVYIREEGGKWLVPRAARNIEVELLAAIDGTAHTWLAEVLSGGNVTFLSGSGDLLGDELPGLGPAKGVAIAAPLMSAGGPLGVAVVLPATGRELTDAQREMLSTFIVQASVAVENSRLFQVERESRRVADALRLVAEQFVTPRSLEESLRLAEPVLEQLFLARKATIAVLDREALGLAVDGESDTERDLVEVVGARAVPKSTPTVFRIGDSRAADRVLARGGSTELLVVPIAANSGHGAVAGIEFGDQGVQRRDLELAETVEGEMALALDNAFLFERALARAESLETVFRISQAVGSSLQVKVVLNRVLDVVQKILSADGVALMTYDQRTHVLSTAMARGRITSGIVQQGREKGDDIPERVFGSGEPIVLRQLTTDMGGVAGQAAALGLDSLVAVPLVTRGRPIGVLTVFTTEPHALSDEDVSLLRTFASQAALALDTARLYSKERDVSKTLQRSLAPDALPEFAELEVGSVYVPAGGETEIGGDYYDLLRAPDGSIWFAIADVCGKGVLAATKTSMIKYYVRALATAGYSPCEVVSELNRVVAEADNPSDIVTLLVGRTVMREGIRTMEWSNGGHPPGLLRHADGSIERLDPTGPLLGALASAPYGCSSVEVGVGDTLLLYTDGVVEARREKEFFGEGRVLEVLEREGNPERIASTLLDTVRLFSRVELRDDAAVLVIRVTDKDAAGIQRAT